MQVQVTVTNTGKIAGDEVVELYLKFPRVAGAPRLALRGFRRVHLVPGASQDIEFDLQPRDLSLVTEAGAASARGKIYCFRRRRPARQRSALCQEHLPGAWHPDVAGVNLCVIKTISRMTG